MDKFSRFVELLRAASLIHVESLDGSQSSFVSSFKVVEDADGRPGVRLKPFVRQHADDREEEGVFISEMNVLGLVYDLTQKRLLLKADNGQQLTIRFQGSGVVLRPFESEEIFKILAPGMVTASGQFSFLPEKS